MFLGILTLVTALTISGVAIYYSVAGLVAIFAAASVPIIIMGSSLEIGKLVAAVWLHKYWERAPKLLKFYLSVAILVLMFITSMGIFGFLSKAHIEQTAGAQEQVAQLERIENEIARQEALIARAEQRIVKAEEDALRQDSGIQEKIDLEQERINDSYNRRSPAIEEQNAVITAQQTLVNDRVRVYEDEIETLDAELMRLNELVDTYRKELTNKNVSSIEDQVAPYLEQIAQLDKEIQQLNQQASEYEVRVSNLQPDTAIADSLTSQITDIEQEIVRVTNQINSNETDQIRAGQAIIGVTGDGLFGGNTRRALANWAEAQQARINQLQSQIAADRTAAQLRIDTERERLTSLIANLRDEQTQEIRQRKRELSDTIKSIRNNATSVLDEQRAEIQRRIDAVLNNDIPTNREARKLAQDTITSIRNEPNTIIVAAREEIARLRALADEEIRTSNEVINRLRAEVTAGTNEDTETIIDEQTNKIKAANDEIDTLTTTKYSIQAETRKLEAEVGPVKYLAEFIYGEQTDKNMLEAAVRWVIIVIIFVFDPLAVVLLIASQKTFQWLRNTEPEKDVTKSDFVDEHPVEERQAVIENTDQKYKLNKEPEKQKLKPVAKAKKQSKKPAVTETLMSETIKAEPDNKKVDNTTYNPYSDMRSNEELTNEQLASRNTIWPAGYDGKLAPPKPFKEDK